MDPQAESSLLTKAGEVDPDERRPAWESYYGDLRKFVARQLGGRHDTDDVVQDIYRELFHSRCAEVTNPRAWVWRIAWRVMHDVFQREKRHRRHYVAADPSAIESLRTEYAGPAPSLESIFETRDELLGALEGLSPAAQIAIVRSRCFGWTYAQIAAELGVTPSMVKKHIGRAIAHFDAYLEREDTQTNKHGAGS